MDDGSVAEQKPANNGEASSPEQFSLFDPEVQSEPYAFYRAMREKCPVYRVPERGLYLISKYNDLDGVLRDFSTFSNVLDRSAVIQGENSKIFQGVLREKGWEHISTLQRSDPPNHTRYRKIIERAFNMRQVRNLESRLTGLANQLIDAFIDKGECDFLRDFAIPFPGIIVAELIGLDSSQYQQFRTWSENLQAYMIKVMTPDELRASAEIEVEMQQYLASVFEDRRKNPREDLMTGLVSAYEGVEALSMHELQNIMHQLIAGGYDTTTNAICHGVWQMIRFPEAAREVRADRSLMRNFIDESLRFESPVQGLYRAATKDIEVAGTMIPKGSLCNVRYGAANRDEAQFPNAGQFDIHRNNANQHLAFGAATHFCPGAMLARSELTIAFNTILDRMDNLGLAKPLPYPVHKPSVGFIPMKEMFLSFTKR